MVVKREECVSECWHCRSTSHSTGQCPGRYRGGAVDGSYEEWLARQQGPAPGDREQTMTNEEIICTFMEPRPTDPPEDICSETDWWVSGQSTDLSIVWRPKFGAWPKESHLGYLREVEDRLTEEQRAYYLVMLLPSEFTPPFPLTAFWCAAHATPEQKIKALGPVLLPYLESKR